MDQYPVGFLPDDRIRHEQCHCEGEGIEERMHVQRGYRNEQVRLFSMTLKPQADLNGRQFKGAEDEKLEDASCDDVDFQGFGHFVLNPAFLPVVSIFIQG